MDQRPPSEYYYGPPGNPYPTPQYMPIPGPYPPRHPGHPFNGYPRPPYAFTPEFDPRYGPRPSTGLQDGLSQPELGISFGRYRSEMSPLSGASSPLNSERASPQEPSAGTSVKELHKSMANERRKKRNREAQQKARQKQKKLIEDLNSQLEQTKREKAQLKAQVQELQQQIQVLLSSNNPGFGPGSHSQTNPYN